MSKRPLLIYDQYTKQKHTFKPHGPIVGMYVCGMTVYDHCHIGHARCMIFFDLVKRVLESAGYPTRYVRNITDIDDKIIRRSQKDSLDVQVLTQRFIDAMWQDESQLGLICPDDQPRATEYVSEMIAWIEALLEKDYAYVGEQGDVYYRISKFSDYGKLSGRKLDQMMTGARVEADEFKENPLDFVLWKSSKPDEPSWSSPWGMGRPGWHLECTVMAHHLLGSPVDIHGGGHDLCFPHHENEIAQAAPLVNHGFVRYWMHVGHVEMGQEKMSKSKGNFVLIRDVLKQYTASEIRYFMLMAHYRHPIGFSDDNWQQARGALERIHRVCDDFLAHGVPDIDTKHIPDDCWKPMLDDFNTPQVMAVLFDKIRAYYQSKELAQTKEVERLGLEIINVVNWLGLSVHHDVSIDVSEIEGLIEQRREARANKNWQLADEIREELTAKGVVLEDRQGVTHWRVDRQFGLDGER